jgi:conjugal transfer pilus assembly protein TraD
MKNKNNGNNQLDLFSQIIDLFHEICMLVFKLVKELAIFGYKKWYSKPDPMAKIERKQLNHQGRTQVEDTLGVDTATRRVMNLSEINFKNHTFIAGASGFGKTNLISILQEHSLRKNKPIIFIDPKGDAESMLTFQKLCHAHHKPCYIFSETYPDSISLNPIQEGTINTVVDRLMDAFEWSEPYYKDASRRSLTKVLKDLEKDHETFTLQKVLERLIRIESKDNLGIITKIESIVESDFGKLLNAEKDGLTLSKIRDEKACVYIGLSTQGYGQTACAIGKLFLGELLHNSYIMLSDINDPKKGLKNPISVYFDEFGSVVVPNFINLQNKCRGAGIELTVAVQTAADIDQISPELTKQVIENSGNLFVLKQRIAPSAQFYAETIGTILTKKQTYRIEEDTKSSTGSEREANEFIVHSDIIKNLNIGQCILLRQGPSRINLINIRNREFDLIKKLNHHKSDIPEIIA